MSWIYLSAVVQAELGEDAAGADFVPGVVTHRSGLSARSRGLADSLMRTGALDASRREYEVLVRDFPELALAHYGLGRVESVLGESTGAAGHYQRAVDLAPEFGSAHYALALAYRDSGPRRSGPGTSGRLPSVGSRRPVPADRLLDKIESLTGTARDLIAEGARLGEAGRLTESIALHLKALEADPADAQAHVNLISLYGRAGIPDSAESALSGRAGTRKQSGRRALQLRRSARSRQPISRRGGCDSGRRSASTHFTRRRTTIWRRCSRRQGKLEEAAAHYRQAIASNPQHRTARFNLGPSAGGAGSAARGGRRVPESFSLPRRRGHPRDTFGARERLLRGGDVTTAQDRRLRALRRARERADRQSWPPASRRSCAELGSLRR